MTLSFREARPEDKADLIALWQACGLTRPWNDPAHDIDLALATQSATLLLGEAAEGIVASVMLGFDGHRGWVYYLAVDPARRRQGHARSLMAAAEAWFRARSVPKINLMVRDDNGDALGFYRALGYETQAVTTLGKRLDGQDPGLGARQQMKGSKA
ncbi:MAG: GNAT family acetyltransferase [Rhodospirillales bacterium]